MKQKEVGQVCICLGFLFPFFFPSNFMITLYIKYFEPFFERFLGKSDFVSFFFIIFAVEIDLSLN